MFGILCWSLDGDLGTSDKFLLCFFGVCIGFPATLLEQEPMDVSRIDMVFNIRGRCESAGEWCGSLLVDETLKTKNFQIYLEFDSQENEN